MDVCGLLHIVSNCNVAMEGNLRTAALQRCIASWSASVALYVIERCPLITLLLLSTRLCVTQNW
jgi:hypothetical protein